jgi:hypothetical protein
LQQGFLAMSVASGFDGDFDGAREQMRALRDLISACEAVFGAHAYEQGVLARAQAGFTALRAMHGDTMPGELIAEAPMIEPKVASVPALVTALQMASGALRSMERLSFVDPQRPITFTGDWAHFGTLTIPDILDRANGALEPSR